MRYPKGFGKDASADTSSLFWGHAILTIIHLPDAPEVAQLNLYREANQSPTNKCRSGVLSRDRKVMCPYRHDATT